MKIIIRWLYAQLLKNETIKKDIEMRIRHECIGYSNWKGLLNKYGYPKNDNGTMMNCWQLHTYYKEKSGKRSSMVSHAAEYDPENK